MGQPVNQELGHLLSGCLSSVFRREVPAISACMARARWKMNAVEDASLSSFDPFFVLSMPTVPFCLGVRSTRVSLLILV